MLSRRVLALVLLGTLLVVPVASAEEEVCYIGVYPPVGITGIISGESGTKVGWFVTNLTWHKFWSGTGWDYTNYTSITLTLSNETDLLIKVYFDNGDYMLFYYNSTDLYFKDSWNWQYHFYGNWSKHPDSPDVFDVSKQIYYNTNYGDVVAKAYIDSAGQFYMIVNGERVNPSPQNQTWQYQPVQGSVKALYFNASKTMYSFAPPYAQVYVFYSWAETAPTCDNPSGTGIIGEGQIPLSPHVWTTKYNNYPAFFYEERIPNVDSTWNGYFIWGVKGVNENGTTYYLVYYWNVTINSASAPPNPILGAIWGFFSWIGGMIVDGIKAGFMALWNLLPAEFRDFLMALWNILTGIASLVYALGGWFLEYFLPFLQLLIYLVPIMVVVVAIENPLAPLELFKWIIGLIQKIVSAIRALIPV